MIYDWYKLPISLPEFLAEELASRELVVLLETIGRTTILVSRGNLVSVTYGDTFLPVNFPDVNPFVSGTLATYLDPNENIWLGFEVSP